MCCDAEHNTSKKGVAPNILLAVIEDQEQGANLRQSLTQQTDYFVIIVHEYQQALEIAEEISPELFIFDYSSSKQDGMALYRQLRTQLRFSKTPVLILNTPFPRVDQLHNDPLMVCLMQPVKQSALLLAIESLLAKDKQASDERIAQDSLYKKCS